MNSGAECMYAQRVPREKSVRFRAVDSTFLFGEVGQPLIRSNYIYYGIQSYSSVNDVTDIIGGTASNQFLLQLIDTQGQTRDISILLQYPNICSFKSQNFIIPHMSRMI